MSEKKVVLEEDDYEDDDGVMFCTTCNGTGFVHGCCDDLCRANGEPALVACHHPKACFTCGGEGAVEVDWL